MCFPRFWVVGAFFGLIQGDCLGCRGLGALDF